MVTQVWITKKPNATTGTALVGLPGIGLVGKIVVDYLIKELKPQKIADIACDAFPPTVITHNGVLELLKDEIYYFEYNKHPFYIVAGPAQPNWDIGIGGTEQAYDFSRTIITALQQLHVTQLITLAGMEVGEQRMTIDPKVIASATDAKLLEEWKKLGAKSDQPEGAISGAAGLLLGIGKTQNIPGVCLMGETSARLVYGDPGASKVVLDLLNKKFHFKVNMNKLDSEAKKIEAAFKKLADQMHTMEHEDKKTDLPYVR